MSSLGRQGCGGLVCSTSSLALPGGGVLLPERAARTGARHLLSCIMDGVPVRGVRMSQARRRLAAPFVLFAFLAAVSTRWDASELSAQEVAPERREGDVGRA